MSESLEFKKRPSLGHRFIIIYLYHLLVGTFMFTGGLLGMAGTQGSAVKNGRRKNKDFAWVWGPKSNIYFPIFVEI